MKNSAAEGLGTWPYLVGMPLGATVTMEIYMTSRRR
jgi:hypothetical protein